MWRRPSDSCLDRRPITRPGPRRIPAPISRSHLSVEASLSAAGQASRCQAIVFGRLRTRFRGYADMIARICLSPHVTLTAGIRTVCSSRVSTSIGLAIIISGLRACLWSYAYVIARKCFTPNITLTTNVCHRNLLPSSTRFVRACASSTLADERKPPTCVYRVGLCCPIARAPFPYRCLRNLR